MEENKPTPVSDKPIEVNQKEIWGNVFAKIKQYGLNNEVLTELKSKYTITDCSLTLAAFRSLR